MNLRNAFVDSSAGAADVDVAADVNVVVVNVVVVVDVLTEAAACLRKKFRLFSSNSFSCIHFRLLRAKRPFWSIIWGRSSFSLGLVHRTSLKRYKVSTPL